LLQDQHVVNPDNLPSLVVVQDGYSYADENAGRKKYLFKNKLSFENITNDIQGPCMHN